MKITYTQNGASVTSGDADPTKLRQVVVRVGALTTRIEEVDQDGDRTVITRHVHLTATLIFAVAAAVLVSQAAKLLYAALS